MTRDHSTHRWVVRKGGDWVEDYPEFCQPLAFAHAFRLAVLEGLSVKEVSATDPWCSECAGPYPLDRWPGSQYSGHWDTCPNRHRRRQK